MKFTQGDSSLLQQPGSWEFTGPFPSLLLSSGACRNYSPAEVSKPRIWAIYEWDCTCLKETGTLGSYPLLSSSTMALFWILRIFGGLGTKPTTSSQSSSPFSMGGLKIHAWKITRSLIFPAANSFLLLGYSNLT